VDDRNLTRQFLDPAREIFGDAGWKILDLLAAYSHGTDGFCAVPIGVNGKLDERHAALVRKRNRSGRAPVITIRPIELQHRFREGPITKLITAYDDIFVFPTTINCISPREGKALRTTIGLYRFVRAQQYWDLLQMYKK
jgi:hypothetical protein